MILAVCHDAASPSSFACTPCFIAAAMRAPVRFAACFYGSSAKWAYRAVVAGCVWPSSAPITGRLRPPATAMLAKL